jgi:TPP-dependent pyruvate/acetoin dehydrogenase alpha subunit
MLQKYRTKDEVKNIKIDPITPRVKQRLLDEECITKAEIKKIDKS